MNPSLEGGPQPSRRNELGTDVLIVGAGPTGLMLANCLAKLGVDAVVVDGKAGPTRESRALGVQARTMELYDQLGLVDRVLAEATPARGIVPGYRSRAFPAVTLPRLGAQLSPFPRIYILEQSRNETLLVENLAALGGSVRWGSSLEGLRLDGTHPVEARLSDGTVRARYVVGADGSGSTVRKLLGIPFAGETNPYNFFVADAVDVRGVVAEHINVRMAADRFLLSFPMGGDDNRLLGVLREDAAGGVPEEAAVRDAIADTFGVTYGMSRWYATYRVHHRVAARFRVGPVFLVGDAAHVHSPIGAQGMNTGLQDAHNLAYKLADAIGSRASDASLDRYEAERRPVAERLVSSTDRAFGAVTSVGPVARFVRSRLVPAVVPVAVRVLPRLPLGRRLFSYVSQTRIHYWMRPDGKHVAGGRRDHIVGRRLPWSGENFESLRRMNWQVHAYSPATAEAAATVAAGLGIDHAIFKSPGFSALRADALYLVRPDGFVAAAADAAHAAAEFERHFARLRR